MVTITHRAGGNTRATWALAYFAMLALVGCGVWLTIRGAVTPATRTITCERAADRCSATGMVYASETVTFAFERLAELNVRREGSDAWLARDRDYWSVETSDPAEVAALDAAVAELHAFAAGEGENVTVTIPNGPPRDIAIGIVIALAGLLQGLFMRRFSPRSRVEIDDRVRVTVSKGIGPAVHRDVAKDAVRAVKQWKDQRGRFTYVNVQLEIEGDAPVLVASEYFSPEAEAATIELAQQLRRALGLAA